MKIARTLPPLVVALWLSLLSAGCVRVPPAHAVAGTSQEELAADVSFLSQPALQGRAPRTPGSRTACRYIENRFRACGLVPWGNEKSYEISFGYGRNIVGMLPGSDPDLASEIVLVSAHYDHLGRDSQGRIRPGAADDASGVAALLAAARQLSLHGPRPKRSVCFVAFDCEEMGLIGSFAFTCRQDVQTAKIAAVVNVDMLGRDFLDVVRHTLFVAGTESYPELRQKIRQSGTEAGMNVVPVGTDLLGPRSDHAAFENRPIPCLFFSCGMFKDYHQPTDTADKLDYAQCARSAKVVLSAVEELANTPGCRRTEATRDTDAQELEAVTAVMAEVDKHRAQAGVSTAEADAFRKLAAEAGNAAKNGTYTHARRAEFAVGAVGILAPSLLGLEGMRDRLKEQQRKDLAAFLPYLAQVYISHRAQLLEGYRQFVAHLLQYRPGPFHGMPVFEYEICQVGEEEILLRERDNGHCALNVLALPLVLRAETRPRWLLKSFSVGIAVAADCIDGEGTREQMADLCLLHLRQAGTNELHARFIKQVLKKLNGTEPKGAYKDLLAERLQRGGFKTEAHWLASCLLSGCPDLALWAVGTDAEDKDGVLRAAICQLIQDRNTRPDVRALAIERAGRTPTPPMLLALCAVVNDTGPASVKEPWPLLRKDYAFADRLEVKTLRAFFESVTNEAAGPTRTVGELARAQLKKATGKDFGNQPGKWQDWVEMHKGPGPSPGRRQKGGSKLEAG